MPARVALFRFTFVCGIIFPVQFISPPCEVISNCSTKQTYVQVPECCTLVSKRREEFWVYKFVFSRKHFMGLSWFSAPRKPIKSVKENCSASFGSQFVVVFSSPRPFFLLLCPSYVVCALLPCFPSLTSSSSSHPPQRPSLSSPLCFRLVLSSPCYIVAVGESVSDSNLSCPIISGCSVAEP